MTIARRLKTNSAIILIVTLWIMAVLTLLALGIGRQTRVDLALSKYKIGKMRSRHTAWSAVFYGIQLLGEQRSSSMEERGLEKTGERLFKDIRTSYGSFDMRQVSTPEQQTVRYGFSDEAQRINLNALTLQNARILRELILELGYDEQTAETVSASLIDWKDADDNLSDRSFGAEEDYYQRKKRPYHCKNAPLESLEEFLSVRGMDDRLWSDLKPYVTIVPVEGPLKVNFSDAPRIVLLALARCFSGARTNTDLSDAQSLVRKVLEYRAGPDGEENTDDDRPVDLKDIVLNAKEKVLASSLLMYEQKRPAFFRMEILAEAEPMRVMTRLNTVIRLSDLSVVSWRRDGE